MATISTTARPAYVYDAGGDQWVPIAWTVLGSGAASAPALTFTGDSNTGLWSPGADTVAFSTGGSERMRITSAGNVGIGTSSPAKKLHIEGDTVLSASTGAKLHLYRFSDTNTAFISSAAGGEITFATGTDGPAERMRINSSGYIGIGTSSPVGNVDVYNSTTTTLYVRGDGSVDTLLRRASANASSPGFYFQKARGTLASPTIVSAGDAAGQLFFQAHDGTAFRSLAVINGVVDTTPGASDMPGRLEFYTTADGSATPTERMRIDSSGNVGIGTSSPSGIFHINSDSSTVVRVFQNTTDSSGPKIYMVKQRGTAASPTVVAANDSLGDIYFYGYDGANRQTAALIQGAVDATPGSGDMPGRLAFYTTADGASSVTERMRIDNAGLITGTGTSLGAWTAYTPTVTASTGTFTTVSATGRYCRIGKIVIVSVAVTITTNGTAAGSIVFTLPSGLTSANGSPNYIGSGREGSLTGAMQQVVCGPNATTAYIQKYDGGYSGANGAGFSATLVYETSAT